jgi:hypothetical protein
MHPGIKALGRFWVDVDALTDNAAERRLDMWARAAKAVIQVKVAEGRIHVVPPHQPHHAAAEPDAFGVAGWAGHQAGSLCELVDLALGFLGGIGRLVGGGFVTALGIAALGDGG